MINKIKEQELLELINNPEIQENIKNIYVFGSTIREDCTEESDIDLIIEIKDKTKTNKMYMFIVDNLTSDCDIVFLHELYDDNFFNNLDKVEILNGGLNGRNTL